MTQADMSAAGSSLGLDRGQSARNHGGGSGGRRVARRKSVHAAAHDWFAVL